ncbi:MAG: DUF3793 family protein [Eubacteriales bacterium]|nr:DUF3793 family protein [Eubacteriales bacterium]
MPTDQVLSYMKECTPQQRLELQVAMQCAPVLKQVKISNLLTVKCGQWQRVRQQLAKCRVICMLLYADGEKEVVFFYRYEGLERHLRKPEVREFLLDFGYGGERYEVAAVMKRLKRRYQQYAGTGGPFPHELGVLLEYPVEDVREFIARKGEGCLLSGYWKVYGNVEKARERFRMYDAAREQAAREIMNGKKLWQIAADGEKTGMSAVQRGMGA